MACFFERGGLLFKRGLVSARSAVACPAGRQPHGPLELAVEVVRLLQAAQPVPAFPVFVGDRGHKQLPRVGVDDDVVVVALSYGEELQLFA
jgi:hypothetical protein